MTLTSGYADDLFDDGVLSLFILFSAFNVLFIQRAQLTVKHNTITFKELQPLAAPIFEHLIQHPCLLVNRTPFF